MRGFIRILGGLALAATAGIGVASAATLPQLDREFYASQVIWLAISFLMSFLLAMILSPEAFTNV